MKSNLVDYTVTLHHETGKAILVSLTGVRSDAVWLPKAVVEVYPHTRGDPGKREISLPSHIAVDKELER